MARDSIATLPNLVSLSRLGMAAVFPFLEGPDERLLLIAAAGATDFLDGYLARSRGTATRIGALIDPFADRCFILVAVFVLWMDGTIDLAATLVLAVRDVAVLGAFLATRGAARFKDITFVARPAGKVVTVLQLAALAIAYLSPAWLLASVLAVGVASVVAIADYARILWRGQSPA
jgi:CDP-diacylglycerol--glycerol-3-phosphate 3-phosphatidyltransferase/cardiolipin synthase